MIDTAIILAGGLGTRLRAAVPDLPKPMAPIDGRPFLEHQLDYWQKQGVRRFIISVGYRHKAISGHFGLSYRGAQLHYAVETEPLGTGGGLLLAAETLNDEQPFLVVNGDTFFAVPLAALVTFHDLHRADWSFALFRSHNHNRFQGMQVAADGRITALNTRAEGTAPALANGGVYLLAPSTLARLGLRVPVTASLENDFLPHLLAQGARIYGYECNGRFIDIGVPEDYHRAGSVLAGRV